MGKSVRQEARARALAAQAAKRRERQEAEKRRSALGVDVVVALEERDAAVARYERGAGEAIVRLTEQEGVAEADLAEWVPGVPLAEIRRLKRVAATTQAAPVG